MTIRGRNEWAPHARDTQNLVEEGDMLDQLGQRTTLSRSSGISREEVVLSGEESKLAFAIWPGSA